MKKIDWIFTSFVWIGQIIVIRERNYLAFVFYSLANGYYSYKWFSQKEYAAFGATLTSFLINIYGFFKWL